MKRIDRIFHITFFKTGSQWVRDVITAPEIMSSTGYRYSGVTGSLTDLTASMIKHEPALHTISGPIYNMSRLEWSAWSKPGDRAIFVSRDPRDMLVSLLYSMLYSHGSSTTIDYYRKLLHSMRDNVDRLTFLIQDFRRSGIPFVYTTWHHSPVSNLALFRYEDLTSNPMREFKRIFDWIGFDVVHDQLEAIIHRLSFEVRSGRQPGDEDVMSHYRRGIPGDWKNHFTKEHGIIWEKLMPGFISELGYASSDDWWQELPDSTESSARKTLRHTERKDLNMILENKLQQAQTDLKEKEQVIQSLALALHDCQRGLHEKDDVIQAIGRRD